MKIIKIFDQDHLNYCSYGQPDGPDDFNHDCECHEELEQIRQLMNDFARLGKQAKEIDSKYYGDFLDVTKEMYNVVEKLKDYKDIVQDEHPDWIELFDALEQEFKE